MLIELRLALMACCCPAQPWIAVASARFNARNTFYRNVAFDFEARSAAAKVFLGSAASRLVYALDSRIRGSGRGARASSPDGHRFGATPFTRDVQTGDFVLITSLSGLALVACIGLSRLRMAIAAVPRQADAEPDATSPISPLCRGLALLYAVVPRDFRVRAGAHAEPDRQQHHRRAPAAAKHLAHQPPRLAVPDQRPGRRRNFAASPRPGRPCRLARYRADTLVLAGIRAAWRSSRRRLRRARRPPRRK